MKSDTIKGATSAIVAVVIVAFGMWQVYQLTISHVIGGDAALGILGPLIGAAAAYVFGSDARSGGARAAERAVQLGANAAAPTTVNNAESVTTGGPTTVSGGK